jgi:hypothetical protein
MEETAYTVNNSKSERNFVDFAMEDTLYKYKEVRVKKVQYVCVSEVNEAVEP